MASAHERPTPDARRREEAIATATIRTKFSSLYAELVGKERPLRRSDVSWLAHVQVETSAIQSSAKTATAGVKSLAVKERIPSTKGVSYSHTSSTEDVRGGDGKSKVDLAHAEQVGRTVDVAGIDVEKTQDNADSHELGLSHHGGHRRFAECKQRQKKSSAEIDRAVNEEKANLPLRESDKSVDVARKRAASKGTTPHKKTGKHIDNAPASPPSRRTRRASASSTGVRKNGMAKASAGNYRLASSGGEGQKLEKTDTSNTYDRSTNEQGGANMPLATTTLTRKRAHVVSPPGHEQLGSSNNTAQVPLSPPPPLPPSTTTRRPSSTAKRRASTAKRPVSSTIPSQVKGEAPIGRILYGSKIGGVRATVGAGYGGSDVKSTAASEGSLTDAGDSKDDVNPLSAPINTEAAEAARLPKITTPLRGAKQRKHLREERVENTRTPSHRREKEPAEDQRPDNNAASVATRIAETIHNTANAEREIGPRLLRVRREREKRRAAAAAAVAMASGVVCTCTQSQNSLTPAMGTKSLHKGDAAWIEQRDFQEARQEQIKRECGCGVDAMTTHNQELSHNGADSVSGGDNNDGKQSPAAWLYDVQIQASCCSDGDRTPHAVNSVRIERAEDHSGRLSDSRTRCPTSQHGQHVQIHSDMEQRDESQQGVCGSVRRPDRARVRRGRAEGGSGRESSGKGRRNNGKTKKRQPSAKAQQHCDHAHAPTPSGWFTNVKLSDLVCLDNVHTKTSGTTTGDESLRGNSEKKSHSRMEALPFDGNTRESVEPRDGGGGSHPSPSHADADDEKGPQKNSVETAGESGVVGTGRHGGMSSTSAAACTVMSPPGGPTDHRPQQHPLQRQKQQQDGPSPGTAVAPKGDQVVMESAPPRSSPVSDRGAVTGQKPSVTDTTRESRRPNPYPNPNISEDYWLSSRYSSQAIGGGGSAYGDGYGFGYSSASFHGASGRTKQWSRNGVLVPSPMVILGDDDDGNDGGGFDRDRRERGMHGAGSTGGSSSFTGRFSEGRFNMFDRGGREDDDAFVYRADGEGRRGSRVGGRGELISPPPRYLGSS